MSRLLLAVALIASPSFAQIPFPAPTPGTDLGGGLPANFEASGIVWHPAEQRLFVVSDQGKLVRMEASGAYVQTWSPGGDLEAVTVANPASSFVYIGRENPDAILEFHTGLGVVTRTFDLTPWMTGASNQGLEGLAFVPDASHPEGGRFFATHQGEGRIYKFSLPISSSTTSTAVQFLGSSAPVAGRTDLKDLCYQPETGLLYACYDADNRLTVLNASGAFQYEYSLPGTSQEGIALRGCELYVTQDGAPEQVVRYRPFPNVLACPPLSVDSARLSLSQPSAASFYLVAPNAAMSGDLYFLLGSSSGTAPGIPLGSVLLPLNPDGYFDFTAGSPNAGPLVNTVGNFPGSLQANAQLVLPAGLPPSLIGVTLSHAYFTFDFGLGAFTFASPAVAVNLVL